MAVLAIWLCFIVYACLGQSDQQWEQFKSTFNRTYAHREEEVARKSVWMGNMELIAFQNSRGLEYRLTMNNFTDRTHD